MGKQKLGEMTRTGGPLGGQVETKYKETPWNLQEKPNKDCQQCAAEPELAISYNQARSRVEGLGH